MSEFNESESILTLSTNIPLFNRTPALAFTRTTSVLAVPTVKTLEAGEKAVAPVPRATPASKVPIPASTLRPPAVT